MRPLNLASRPFRNDALPAAIFAVASAVLLGLSVEHALVARRLLSGSTSAMNKQVAALEEESGRLRGAASRRVPQPEKSVLAQWALLKDLVDRRTFSWTELLASLEEVQPPGVRLVSITPRVSRGEIRIDVSAVVRSTEDGLGFVKALEERPEFADVYPTGVTTQEEGGAFRYTMRYVPSARAAKAKPAGKADKPPPAGEEPSDENTPAEEPPAEGEDVS